MPTFDYFCEANGKTVEVRHGADEHLTTWAELCAKAGLLVGDTSPDAPVRRLVSAPHVAVPISHSKLKDLGFTKLVKRDKGVYENVTRTGREKRYMREGDESSLPDLKGKIKD